jgi:hypothetical protein
MYMGDLGLATEMSTRLQNTKVGILKAHMLYPARVFFFGLVAIGNFRKTGKRKFKLEAAKHVSTMRQWVEKKAANMLHKFMILDAEYETLENKNGAALQQKYDLAISTARKSGFLQDAALASQLAGATLLSTPDVQHYADAYIRKSYLMYKTWGAMAPANQLKKTYPDIFSEDKPLTNIEGSNFFSRERFDRRVSLDHQRRLSED